ncbi:MAG TPA: ParB/RepB/Spo0J family partition protein [Anaerolineae bacterium]|nr:ParB/RepB/Spo0J family partition protein [Anaerolineae bacterium]HIP95940.1 ParB/RepB/Spo0J family partition protein [Anaerolineae bacterium]
MPKKPTITGEILEESEALEKLIGTRERATLHDVLIEDIDPNPFNPRQDFAVEDLVASMREHGFIGALDGRLVEGRVQLGYGSRRLLAAKEAGIERLPVYLHDDWDDQQMLVIALVENVQREDLTPLQEATSVGQMHQNLGWSVREIARRTGKPKSWVQDALALFKAPEDVKAMVRERPDSIRQARFIARLPEGKDRQKLVEKVLARELTTAQVVEIVRAVEKGQDVERAVASLLPPPIATPAAAVEPTPALSQVKGPAMARRAVVSAEERLLDPRPILRAVRDQLRQIVPEHLDTLEPRRGWGIRKLLEEIIAEATALRDRLPRPD